jgi:hypothetical protein
LTFLREQLQRDRGIMEKVKEVKQDFFAEVRNNEADHPILKKAIMIDKWQEFLNKISAEGESNTVRRLGYIKIPHVLNVSQNMDSWASIMILFMNCDLLEMPCEESMKAVNDKNILSEGEMKDFF